MSTLQIVMWYNKKCFRGFWSSTLKHSPRDLSLRVSAIWFISHLGWLVILSKWNLHLFLDPTLSRIIFLSQWVLFRSWCDIIKNVLEIGPLWNRRRATYCYDVITVFIHFRMILSKYNFLIIFWSDVQSDLFSFLSDHKEIVTISLLLAKNDVWLNCSKVMIHLTLVDTRLYARRIMKFCFIFLRIGL